MRESTAVERIDYIGTSDRAPTDRRGAATRPQHRSTGAGLAISDSVEASPLSGNIAGRYSRMGINKQLAVAAIIVFLGASTPACTTGRTPLPHVSPPGIQGSPSSAAGIEALPTTVHPGSTSVPWHIQRSGDMHNRICLRTTSNAACRTRVVCEGALAARFRPGVLFKDLYRDAPPFGELRPMRINRG